VGGVISSGGPIAIQMANSQTIWNRGTIVGDALLGSMDDTLIAS